MINLRRGKRTERGDTIVEVLISIAVVSLVLTGAYAAASHNTRSIQDAQERSEAIQLAQRQVELIKADNGDQIARLGSGTLTGNKCYLSNGTAVIAQAQPANDQCTLKADGSQAASASYQPAYQIRIEYDPAGKLFNVNVNWTSVLNGNTNNLTVPYRPIRVL